MEEQFKPRYPQLYEKYKSFTIASFTYLNECLMRGQALWRTKKSKVSFTGDDNLSISYEYKPWFSMFINNHEEDIKKLSEFIELENELKKHPNFQDTIGMKLTTFLSELAEKTKSFNFNSAVFDNVYDDFEAFLCSRETLYQAHGPLKNFRMDENMLVLEENIKIKKLTEDEVSEMLDTFEYSIPRWEIVSWRHRIEVYYKLKEGDKPFGGNPHSEAINNIYKVISALRLFKKGDVANQMYYYLPISWSLNAKGIASGNSPFQSKSSIESKFKLEISEIDELKKFWFVYKELLPRLDNFLFLAIAINRFNSAYENERIEDRLIDYMIAFEALFLKGNEQQELSYRLGLRTAVLLEETSKSKQDVFKNMRTAYNLRSLVVHGKSYEKIKKDLEQKHKNINEFIFKIEGYLRNSIKRFIDLIKIFPNQEEIIKDLDSKILR